MDLLSTYESDDESERDHGRKPSTSPSAKGCEKRRKIWSESNPIVFSTPSSTSIPPPAACGRYVSKREREREQAAQKSHNIPSTLNPSPVLGSISDSMLPSRILSQLTGCGAGDAQPSRIPKGLSVSLTGHTKAVNAVQWSPTHGHLLASAGMDHITYIWNVWNGVGQQKARLINHHNAAIKDVQWSKQGLHLLTGGYDKTSRLTDVETGSQIQVFSDDQIVSVLKFHPRESDLFLSGGSKGSLRLWDIRANKVAHEYLRGLGPILDIDFSYDGKHFASSCDISQTNSSEKSIVVWDFWTQVPLSNQVYVEAYTCPCIRYHPVEANFVAQSNGNYIAIFSSNPPFKLNKYKRFEKHEVSGFPIRCNFSHDGELLVTGSADGYIYFYSYRSSKVLRRIQAHGHACTDVVYHPLIPSVVASCSWDGAVSIFE